ncbi:MAG: DUF5009 domain-containing protein [Kiritimatiellae bacterium]|nr:DUF5009 domain-containing protein [Kiritimatiellia bacterium]
MEVQNTAVSGRRLASLDAFRGFDMMFIMGFFPLCVGIAHLFGVRDEVSGLLQQFHHVRWDGFHFIDSVFPTFLFIAGVAFPFSLAKSREKGMAEWKIYLRTLKRGVLLLLLGIVYNGCLTSGCEHFRFASVLQRIGMGWMFAGFIFMAVKSWKVRAVVFAAVSLFWWLFVQCVGAPGAPAGIDYMAYDNAQHNIVVWVDHHLPGFLRTNWKIEPEGMLSHIGGVLTAMIGMFAGEFVMKTRGRMSGGRQCAAMWAAAAALMAAGFGMIAAGTPVIKAIWSSSFVYCVGAYSLAMFALFYWIIDVRGWQKWSFFFRVIGMNSITVYFFQNVFRTWDPKGPIGFFIGTVGGKDVPGRGLCGWLGEPWGVFIWGVVYFFGLWLVLYWLYRKNIFFKVG